jgi:KUP system potassium uptake protein
VVAGAIVFAVMATWRRGQEVLQAVLPRATGPTQQAVAGLGAERAPRVRGTAVVMMRTADAAPMALLHHFKHNKVLHERVVLMSVVNEAVPMVPPAERVEVEAMPAGFYVVTAHYVFMEHPYMPEILRRCEAHGLSVDVTATTFLLRRVSLLPTGRTRMARWRKRLFAFMQRNEQSPDQFYEIPPNRVMEIGMRVEF